MNIIVPKIGVEDGDMTIASWEVATNDYVQKEQLLAIIETEKITSEITSPGEGYIQILKDEASTVRALDKIALLSEEVTKPSEVLEEATVQAISETEELQKTVIAESPHNWPNGQHLRPSERRKKVGQLLELDTSLSNVKMTPKAKFIARARQLDVNQLKQQIDKSIIFAKDVEEFTPRVEKQLDSSLSISVENESQTIPHSGMRRAIAKNMMDSLQNTAQMSLMGELDVSKMSPYYKEIKALLAKENVKFSWNVLFMKIVALALEKYPQLNSSADEKQLTIWKDINIGMAVSNDKGLVVPNVKHVNKQSLQALSESVATLVELGKTNALKSHHFEEGTFTITNVGSYGGEFGTPILNKDQTAILALGKIEKKPIVNEFDEIVIGHKCYYSLTVDHRVIDGELAGQFINEIRAILQHPLMLFKNGGI